MATAEEIYRFEARDISEDDRSLSLFTGPEAIRHFLNPDNHALTSMVEIPETLNRFLEKGVRIFAKCAYQGPLLNVKALTALNMLWVAKNKGFLDDVKRLAENTSGNFGVALAIIAHQYGINDVVAISPADISQMKAAMLVLAGAKTSTCPTGGIAMAKQMGKYPGCFNLNQYGERSNPGGIERWLAPQIWKQMKGKLDIFCAGMGTCGTVTGVASYLEKMKAKTTIVGVRVARGSAVPGVRTEERLREISLDWKKYVNNVEEATTKESYKKSLELVRLAIMAGPSSGFALAGLLKFLGRLDADGKLDALRNGNKEIKAVFICPDTPFLYLDKYTTVLDSEDFAVNTGCPETDFSI